MAATSPRLNAADFLVVLRAASGERATKRLFRLGDGFGVESAPDDVKRWRWERVPVGGLDDIEEALNRVAGDSSACVIGDDIRDGAGPVILRRIEGEGADLRERGRRWLAFDCDGWLPPGWPLSAAPTEADIRAAVRALVDTLPGLEGAECVYKLSATAGLVKSGDGVRVPGWASLRCHVWFWFDRPVFPPSVKAWLVSHFPDGPKGSPGWDGALFHRTQVHYVASPVIEGGDIVGVSRIGRIEGRAAFAPAQWLSLEDWREAEAVALANARARLAAIRLAQAERHRDGDGDDIDASVRRMLAGRVRANIEGPANMKPGTKPGTKPACDASEPDSGTAFNGALRALTAATALETLGEVGAVRDCEDMLRGVLLSLGKGRNAATATERCIRRALAKVNPGAVADSLAGARAAHKPPMRTRNAFPDAVPIPANDIEPARRPDASPARPATSGGPSMPDDVAGLYGAFLGALCRDWTRWPADIIATLGGCDGADDAATVGAGIIGDECRELFGRFNADIIEAAGFVSNGRPWGPLATGAAPVLIVPVFSPTSGGPVGFVSGAGVIVGERWPVGLRWPGDSLFGSERSTRPVVLVRGALDALAFGGLALGLPGEDGALSLDVVAVGDAWRPEWADIIEGRAAVVVALPRESPALTAAVKAAKASGVPVIGAGTKAKTWRDTALDIGRRAVVEHWRAKAREVLR